VLYASVGGKAYPLTGRHCRGQPARKEKRISLGVYPDVGLKRARDRRDEMRKLVADGVDPSAARKHEKLMALDAAENTFEAVAREWLEKHSPNWEASYSMKLLVRLEANVFPWLGHRPIRDIKAPELLSGLPKATTADQFEAQLPWNVSAACGA
jgi:hypothetical protein